ncbi:hypothetical protein J6590_005460 [Homalodisca vitripennis]|nr:hypothetical protein J6590_005460 [Homalodisca vitripennis]
MLQAFPARERTPVGGSCPPAGGPSRARARSSSPYGGSCPPGMAPPRVCPPVAGPPEYVRTPPGRPRHETYKARRRLYHGSEGSECEDLNSTLGTLSSGESVRREILCGLLDARERNRGWQGATVEGSRPQTELATTLPPPTVHSWAEGHMQSVGLYKIVQALVL